MKQRMGALAVILGMVIAGLVVQDPVAQAADSGQRRPTTVTERFDPGQETGAALRGCWVTPTGSRVNARSAATTRSPRNGIIYSGQRADADCSIIRGGHYDSCGGGDGWIRVTWPARVTSYVARQCVYWSVD